MTIQVLSIGSAQGGALMARHRAPMSPLVLLDGQYFSSGRLPRRKVFIYATLRDHPPRKRSAPSSSDESELTDATSRHEDTIEQPTSTHKEPTSTHK